MDAKSGRSDRTLVVGTPHTPLDFLSLFRLTCRAKPLSGSAEAVRWSKRRSTPEEGTASALLAAMMDGWIGRERDMGVGVERNAQDSLQMGLLREN